MLWKHLNVLSNTHFTTAHIPSSVITEVLAIVQAQYTLNNVWHHKNNAHELIMMQMLCVTQVTDQYIGLHRGVFSCRNEENFTAVLSTSLAEGLRYHVIRSFDDTQRINQPGEAQGYYI